MDKVIRDGKVAILYSPNYGAGWYTWSHKSEDDGKCLFHPDVVAWVEAGKPLDIVPDFKQLFGDGFYAGGAGNLTIEWLPVGTKFRIDEYDGFETVVIETDLVWWVA